jgi:methanogenic corrinoid protein MtbC1
VHYMTVYRYVRTGRLPGRKVGAEWRIDPRDLAAFVSTAATTGPGRGDDARGRPGAGSNGGRGEGPNDGSADGSIGRSPAGTNGAGRMSTSRRRIDYSRRLVDRLVAGDERGSWTIVQSALSAGLDPDDVYLQVLAPALETIGEQWAEGVVSVGQEHQASVVVLRLIGRLGPLFTRRGRTRGTVVLGAPPGDNHSLPSALFADLLRGLGMGVIDLGADTPTASFVDAAGQAERLLAVAVSVTTPGNDAAVIETVAQVKQATDAPVIVGGGGVQSAEHAAELGSDAYTTDEHAALALFARLADDASRARRQRTRRTLGTTSTTDTPSAPSADGPSNDGATT